MRLAMYTLLVNGSQVFEGAKALSLEHKYRKDVK